MLSQLRQARYGYLLGLHILLLCAKGHTPSEIADSLFCSRSSVYRTVAAYQSGEINRRWCAASAAEAPPKLLGWQRSLVAVLKRTPQAYGWCRTRWSCQTLALQLAAQRGFRVSRETLRRTLHQLGYAWKRARHAARDDDPDRVSKLARIRHLCETLPRNAALFFADELDIHLLPKLGYSVDAEGDAKRSDDAGHEPEELLGRRAQPRDGQTAVCGGRAEESLVVH